MSKNCSQCGSKIGFLGFSETIEGSIYCRDCTEKYRATRDEKVRKEIQAKQERMQVIQDGIVESMRTELAPKSPTDIDIKYAAKLDALRNLVMLGTLTAAEFEVLKPTLLQYWSQGDPHQPRGRFTEMYEQAKELISRQLVAPASAQYPALHSDMIAFFFEKNQLVITTYVDSQARSSALLRSNVRAKFDLETDTCLGISFFHDVNPPWQKMEWGPYALV